MAWCRQPASELDPPPLAHPEMWPRGAGPESTLVEFANPADGLRKGRRDGRARTLAAPRNPRSQVVGNS